MTSPDQSKGSRSRDEVLAGEYVLGVLPDEERQRVLARIVRDHSFAAIVERWERNLADANDESRQTAISFAEYLSLENRKPARIKGLTTGRHVGTQLWNSLVFWRTIAIIAVIIAVLCLLEQA